jgi:hypothetical protein
VAAKRRREHFGAGALTLNAATSVFLNCPYDLQYLPLFDCAVLATICCGFTPRSALESGTVAEPRMARITRAISSQNTRFTTYLDVKEKGMPIWRVLTCPLNLA